VYDDSHVDAFKSHPVYHPPKPAEEAAAPAPAVADGVFILRFLHKLQKSGAIRDKGAALGDLTGVRA
jgi:hypothetical protein